MVGRQPRPALVPAQKHFWPKLTNTRYDRFRLINAVLGKPAEMPTINRVANALGDVGHLSMAAAFQNLMLLWLLSKVVWPGVASFCAFAAVALIFDFVFHLTFFLAVLSVDVRRMELHESLEKANAQETAVRTSRPAGRQLWIDALLRNELPPSTRIAGSAILICFTLLLNWHFDHQTLSLVRLLRWVRKGGWQQSRNTPLAPPPINQARTPAAWLRMQEYDTAQEVIRFVKPDSHNFIARVYDPLTVVRKNADRVGDGTLTLSIYHAIWRFIEAHFFPFALTVVFTIAVVTVLMNYLLWNELPVEEPGEEIETDLNVRHLPKAHNLDVVKLWTSPKGHMVSVSLDRVITVWYWRSKTHAYSQSTIQPMLETPKLWPIVAGAINDTGTWLALCTATGDIALFSLHGKDTKRTASIELDGQMPCGFGFLTLDPENLEAASLIILTPTGNLTALDLPRLETTETHSLEHGITSSVSFIPVGRSPALITSISRYTGELLVTTKSSGRWKTRVVDVQQHGLAPPDYDDFFRVRYIHSVPQLGLIVLVRPHEIDLIDSRHHKLISTVSLGDNGRHVAAATLRVLHGPRRNCTACNASAVHSLSFAYTENIPDSSSGSSSNTSNGGSGTRCVMRTFAAGSDPTKLICLRPAFEVDDESCVRLASGIESISEVERPGVWDATGIQAIIGLRRRPLRTGKKSNSNKAATTGATTANSPFGRMTRRNRKSSDNSGNAKSTAGRWAGAASWASSSSSSSAGRQTAGSGNGGGGGDSEEWECWMLSSDGEFQSAPLRPAKQAADHLYVTMAGPVARLGRRSVAAVLGNTVKVVMLGVDKFDDGQRSDDPHSARVPGGRRKPRTAAAAAAAANAKFAASLAAGGTPPARKGASGSTSTAG